MDKILLKQFIFHGSWLALVVAAWLLWRLRDPRRRWLVAVALVPVLVFLWSRFVEPQIIRVRETTLAGVGFQADIALVADLHLGIYKDTAFLDRLVDRIDAMPVDAVAIAGDLTYEADPAELDALFAPLARLRVPVYAVLGNHDQLPTGRDVAEPLRRALEAHGVRVIEGGFVEADGWRWAGLGDRWSGQDDPAFLRASPSPLPTLALTHNPDTSVDLVSGDVALLLAGHTHGGQIRIPWLYRRVIPSRHGFDRGEQWQGPVRVFTTSGTGEIGLPLRLFNPPTIDVLHLRR